MLQRPAGPLLLAKHAIPPARVGLVHRQRLTGRLLATAAARLTVVVAPAGWGKTTLLAQWTHDPAESRRVVWLTLDDSDDEPVRFWTYVLTALAQDETRLGAGALAALSAPGLDPVDVALPTLLNELGAAAGPQVLVLDDYHVLTDQRIHEGMEFLLSYLPPALRLVMASRSDPPLPLARLRGRGELIEIRSDDLRFRTDEAAALIAAIGAVHLDATAAATLCERVEGWAVGLQLAALSVREATRPQEAAAAIRGDDRHILDYLHAEVIDRLPPEQRDLLVRSCMLERLSGPLCDAVLESTGSAAILAELERSNVFVLPLDHHREWYRCHRLFRDVLRRELDAVDADCAPRLQRRAADWFLAHGHIEEAIHHRCVAGDRQGAAHLLVSSAAWFLANGAAARFVQLGEELVPTLDPPDPRVPVTMIFAAAASGRFDRVLHWLAVAEPLVTDDSPALPGWCSLRAALLTRRALFGYTGHGDLDAALVDARRAALLETDATLPGYAITRGTLGSMLMAGERFEEAVNVLEQAWRSPGRLQLPTPVALAAAGTLGLCLLRTERTDRARRVCEEFGPVAAAAEAAWGDAAAAAVAQLRIVQGRLARRDGDLGAACAQLRRAVELAAVWGQGTVLVAALTSLAEAQLSSGDRTAAHETLARAREGVAAEPIFPFVVHELEAVEARLGRGASRAARRSGRLVEELTDRELEILRALTGSATQREIGAALFLSVNTVKGYTKSLYRKLDVATRDDAVRVGHELALI
jgi:LuxR family maltose regulon positive regulatory protein